MGSVVQSNSTKCPVQELGPADVFVEPSTLEGLDIGKSGIHVLFCKIFRREERQVQRHCGPIALFGRADAEIAPVFGGEAELLLFDANKI